MRWVGCAALIFALTSARGQAPPQKRIDSLQNLLSIHWHDTLGIDIRNKLAEEFVRKDLALAKSYLYQAIAIAEELSTVHGLSNSYSQLTTSYQDTGQPDSARFYLVHLEKLYSAHPSDKTIESNFNMTAGLYYKRQGNYKAALSYMLAGLTTMKDGHVSQAGQFLNIGNTYFLLGELRSAADYHLKSLRAFERLENKRGQSFCYQSLGEDLFELYQYKESLDYFSRSLKLKEELKDARGKMTAWRGLGKVNRELLHFDKALKYFNQSLAQAMELNLTLEESQTLNEMALLYANRNDKKKAKQYFEQSLGIARKSGDSLMIARINAGLVALNGISSGNKDDEKILLNNIFRATSAGDNHSLPEAYYSLAQWYAGHGQYEKGFRQLQRYVQLNDSLRGKDVVTQLNELEAQYLSEKKENEIKALTVKNEINALEIRQQATQRNYLIGLVVLFVVLIAVLYNRYTIKQKASQKLEEIDQLKSKFFANISHEFRTPLSLILGPLQKSLDQSSPPEEKDVNLMHRNAQRLNTLIDQMLDLAKIESRSMQLHAEPGPLAHFIKTLFSAFSSLAEQRRIVYTLQLEGEMESGYFDADKLDKILYNLISNAFKFTADEGVVSVKAIQAGGKLTVRVMDSGIGISPEHREKIFDRFFQVDDANARNREGAGIGLSLSKELATIHQGTLSVESELGKGSIFTLMIPVMAKAYRLAVSSNGKPTIDHRREVSSPPTPRLDFAPSGESDELPLVLVVEDNSDMRMFVVDTLRDGYRIETAVDGWEGWEKAQALVPDIIVSDIMMPRLDGNALCTNVRTTTATSHIPVVLLTARADRESKAEGLQTGADDYLTKPFDSQELRIRIQNLISQREKLKALFSQRVTLQPKDVLLTDPEAGFIKRMMEVVEGKFSDPAFGVDEFTVAIGLSRMQLHRKLKALAGKSTGDFLRNFRLERAKQLLTVGNLQVSEVAYQCGFSNVSHFTKVFKEFAGVLPSKVVAPGS